MVDETGDLKKGTHTVGVQRQYTGTAGRIENAQVAVYLVYAGAARARDDRPRAVPARGPGPSDPDRLAEAGVPTTSSSPTKPALATGMLTRALDAGVPAAWVAGDEVYGADPGLRAELRGQRGSATCWRSAATAASPPTPARSAPTSWPPGCPGGPGSGSRPGAGAKGHRFYDWAWIDHTDRARRDDPLDTQCWSLLIRRHRDTGELAFYRCYSPDTGAAARAGPRRRAPLDHRGGLPGRQGPGRAGRAPGPPLDLLAPLDPAGDDRPRLPGRHSPPTSTPTDPHPTGLIALTCNEIRRLFTTLIVEPARASACPLRLVTLATPPPTPRPHQPLPAPTADQPWT